VAGRIADRQDIKAAIWCSTISKSMYRRHRQQRMQFGGRPFGDGEGFADTN